MEASASFSQERVEVHLTFEGPEVDDGTMPLQDIVPVLQGFSGAYAKLSESDYPNSTYRLKIIALDQGSADIVLEILTSAAEGVVLISGVTSATVQALKIVRNLAKYIQIKRHVKNEPFLESISADNSIVIVNSRNVSLEVAPSVHEHFKQGKLDRDLELFTRPLEPGRIDKAEIRATSDNGDVLVEGIAAEERPYFALEDLAATSTQRTELIVQFNSLTKTTNNGFLHLTNGKRVSYRYRGDKHQQFYSVFGNSNGPVKVECEAKLDEHLEVLSLDIFDFEPLQQELPNLGPKKPHENK